ncbi:penicillin-binding transpeptidase domain-containing protein [Aeromicrobium sp.]|uniref:penicillin-binding transpeptidase domain-containing protein n=1 Tax=Aeromicrobium sp. TaxID=1871063 RepID=UPI0035149D62
MRQRRPARLRIVAATAGPLVAAGVLVGCSLGGPDPEEPARALAEGLSKGDVTSVPTTGDGARHQADLERVVADVGGRRQVEVTSVEEDDGSATAELRHRWTIGGSTWSYETTATLVQQGGTWRVRWEPSVVAPVKGGETLAVRTTPAERGDVLGVDDAPLVTARPVVRVGIDKTAVGSDAAGTSAQRLAQLLDIDPGAYRARVEAAGDRAFVEGLVLRADGDVPTRQELAAIPGSLAVEGTLPLAPTRAFGQPLLGTVGEATAEVVEKSDGAVRSGDQVGLSGLQARYDEQLRGTPGLEVLAVDDDPSTESRRLFSSAPKAGEPLRTTLDPAVQSAADRILADVGPASAIVAIRPSTGALLAVSSGPGGDGADTALTGRYAPGSTFKVATALALLRSGLTPDSRVPCTPTVTVDGRRFENYSDYPASALGDVPLRTAFAQSCNTAMIAERERAPQDELAAAAAGLGLGRDVDLGIPAFLGQVPTRADGTERAASVIGQGRVEASPLAMAVVAASVAHGSTVTPVLLPDRRPKQAPGPDEPVTRAQARSLAGLMRAVVTDGSGAFLRDLPGGPVRAKTGTAEYGDDQPPRTHAWMIATQGDLAVAVFVADGDSGSATAGPLLERFLRR